MDVLKYVQEVKNVAMENIEGLQKPLYDHKGINVKLVGFMSRTLSSRTIHGGNGDRDVDQTIGITSDGWVKYVSEVETLTINTPFVMNSLDKTIMSDEEVANYLNSDKCKIGEVYSFIDVYNKISSKYKGELENISALTETVF